MSAERIGIWVVAIALAGLGVAEIIAGRALPGLHALPPASPAWLVQCIGAILAASALGSLFSRWSSLALAAIWLAAFAFALIGASPDLSDWAPRAEAAVFAVFALWRWDPARGRIALRLAFGLMLLLFGAIHLLQREIIASLIPDWMPWREHWPWATGGASLIAGVACLAGRGVRVALLAIGMMYLAWLPVVHAPRLLADINSSFEWTFALTALALAGVALAVSSTGRTGYEAPDD